jgi:aryl-alcohol dehydrogenase-like predicted oxidoreductase
MEYRKLGETDIEISAITLGAWVYGKDAWADVRDDESVQAIHAALDGGINIIDTAAGYGGGYSEQVVGEAVKDRRDEVLLASKCGAQPDRIPEQIDVCLQNMQLDCIDIYQVHYPSPRIPIADTIGAMAEIQQAGKIRFIGVSNFSREQLREALDTARIETSQPPFNLFWREIEDDHLPLCREKNIAVLPYSPLAQGLLAGRFRTPEDIPDDIRSKNKLMAEGTFEQCVEVVQYIEEVASRHGKSIVQAAINWTINYPGITSAIVGARRPEQAQENIGGCGWRLTDEEMEEISQRGLEIARQMDYSSNMWGYAPR